MKLSYGISVREINPVNYILTRFYDSMQHLLHVMDVTRQY